MFVKIFNLSGISCGIARSLDVLLMIEILSVIPLVVMMSRDIVAMVASISQAYTLEAPALTANMLEKRKEEGERISIRLFTMSIYPYNLN